MIKLISKFFFTSCVLIFTHNYAIAASMQSLGKGEGTLDIVAWAGYIERVQLYLNLIGSLDLKKVLDVWLR